MSLRALYRGLAIVAVLYCSSSLATAQSTVFSEPSCVLNCVGYADCGFNSPKCMCKAAQGNLLNQVLDCMSVHCSPDELASADEAFLDAMQILCSGIDHPIPAAAIMSAEGVASSLLSKATATAGQTPQPTTSDGPVPTGGATSSPASDTDSPAASSTSEQAAGTTSDSSPRTTVAAASSTTAQSSTSTTAAVNHDPTDSTPFATPNAAAPRRAAPYVLAAVPFAAWLAV